MAVNSDKRELSAVKIDCVRQFGAVSFGAA